MRMNDTGKKAKDFSLLLGTVDFECWNFDCMVCFSAGPPSQVLV